MITQTHREVLKKIAYVTPAILTLAAVPAFAGGRGSKTTKITRQAQYQAQYKVIPRPD